MSRQKKQARLELRDRGDGRAPMWVILDVGMKRVSTGCGADDAAGAEAKFREYLIEKAKKEQPAKPTDASAVRLGHMVSYYLNTHGPKTAGEETLKIQGKHLEPFWAALTMADMIEPNRRAYVEQRVKQGYKGRPLKPVTAWKELNLLGTAVKRYCIAHNIPNWPRFSDTEGEAKSAVRERVLERHEFARMLLAARRLGFKHIVRFLLIARDTGTRLDCLLRLRWMPSTDGGNINTQRAVMYRLALGEKETRKRKPACELGPKLLANCRRWQKADMAAGLSHVIHTQGQPISDLRNHWDEAGKPRNPWTRVIEAAGLAYDAEDGRRTSDVTPHILRHTCVSWALWEGRQPLDIAQHVGMSLTMLEKVYGHHRLVAKEYQRAKAERLAKKARG